MANALIEPEFLRAKEWISIAPDRYRILMSHIEIIRTQEEKFQQRYDDPYQRRPDEEDLLVEPISVDPSVLYPFNNGRFQEEGVAIIAQLYDSNYLARTFKFGNVVTFLIINDQSNVIFEFTWNMLAYWSCFGYGRPGGCCPTRLPAQFSTWLNHKKELIIIAGPVENDLGYWQSTDVPSAKILHTKTWSVEPCLLALNGKIGWPAGVLFDPRTGREHLAWVVCSTRCTPFHRANFSMGTLVLFDAAHNRVVQEGPDYVIGGNVHLFHHNKHLLILQSVPGNNIVNRSGRQLLILSADNMQSLQLVSFSQLTIPKYVNEILVTDGILTSIFESACEKHLSVILSTFRGNVALTFPLKLPKDSPQSLKQLCRTAILLSINVQHISELPLPFVILKYLEGYET